MNPNKKKMMDEIYKAFRSYIDKQTHFDIDYMEKYGYVFIATDQFTMDILKTPEAMLEVLCLDLIEDELCSSTPYTCELTERTKNIVRRRLTKILGKIEGEEKDYCLKRIEHYLDAYQKKYMLDLTKYIKP